MDANARPPQAAEGGTPRTDTGAMQPDAAEGTEPVAVEGQFAAPDFFRDLQANVAAALQEDVGAGDLTASLIDSSAQATASVITREPGVICGRPWVDEVFRQVNPEIEVTWQVEEGDDVAADAQLLQARGQARALLTAERTALNFLQLLSGVATQARRKAALIADAPAQLLDTRKTLPGLRLAQKYAVRIGGAANHRLGLYDAFLIKENHIAAAGSIAAAIAAARQAAPAARVEVEVETLAQLKEALAAKPDWIMLDNFPLQDVKAAVAQASGTGIKLEASGSIATDQSLRALAQTGIHYISQGALTKHITVLDLSLRLSM